MDEIVELVKRGRSILDSGPLMRNPETFHTLKDMCDAATQSCTDLAAKLRVANIANFARDLYERETDPEIARKLRAALEIQLCQLEKAVDLH